MTFKRVILESIGLAIVSIIALLTLNGLGIYVLTGANYLESLNELESQKNITGLLLYTITMGSIAVFIEEVVFRLVPFNLSGKNTNPWIFWPLGFLTSILFAITHTNLTNGFEFPLVQFTAGLFFWSLIRYKNGIELSVLSHFTYNFTIIFLEVLSIIFS